MNTRSCIVANIFHTPCTVERGQYERIFKSHEHIHCTIIELLIGSCCRANYRFVVFFLNLVVFNLVEMNRDLLNVDLHLLNTIVLLAYRR